MLKSLSLFIGLTSAIAAQTIREARLDPKQALDLPVSREVTTIMVPGPITAVAGADMLIEGGKQTVEVEEGTPLRFHVSHAAGSNFILVRSLQPDAAARLTAIYDGSCAGSELGCNDDACGLQSRIDFNAISGRVYIVQFGSQSAGTAGAGAFTIDVDAPIFNQANGSSYRLVDGMVPLRFFEQFAVKITPAKTIASRLAPVAIGCE